MPARRPHCGNQLIRAICLERVSLQMILIHDPLSLLIHPGLPE